MVIKDELMKCGLGRLLASTLLMSTVILGCGSSDSATAEVESTAAPQAATASQTRTVVIAPVQDIEFRDSVALSAEVTPWAAVDVAAQATGRIVSLSIEIGDRVAEGTILARVDDTLLRAELAQAEAQLEQARVNLAQAERDLSRGQQLERTQDISIDDLDRLALARDTAKTQVAGLEAALTRTRQNLQDTEVKAPFTGVVSDRKVEVGSWIAPGSILLRLVDDRRVKVRGSASQKDRARIQPGLPAEIMADALPGETFAGKVRLLGQEADAQTGTYLVEARVDEPRAPSGQRLLPGMQGTMKVLFGARQTLMVPRSSMIQTPQGDGLFVVRDDEARFLQPQTGVLTADRIEILSELKRGDQVIVIGQHVLRDGDPVKIDRERSQGMDPSAAEPSSAEEIPAEEIPVEESAR